MPNLSATLAAYKTKAAPYPRPEIIDANTAETIEYGMVNKNMPIAKVSKDKGIDTKPN